MHNTFFDWMQYWQQQAQQSAAQLMRPDQYQTLVPSFNPFQQFQEWQNQQKNIFSNFVPHNDLLGFWNSMSRYNLQNINWHELLMTPYFSSLQKAFEHNNLEAQKHNIQAIGQYWFEKSNLLVGKHLTSLEWQKDTLKMFVEQTRWEAFGAENKDDYKAYCDALIDSYEQIIALIHAFDGFETDLADRFLQKCLESDIALDDVEQLFSVWCDLFDSCYNECVFSAGYCKNFAAFVSAISRFRMSQQKIIDKNAEMFGLPSKREMDSVHKTIHRQQKVIRKFLSVDDRDADIDTLKSASTSQQRQLDGLQAECATIAHLQKEIKVLKATLVDKDTALHDIKSSMAALDKSVKQLSTAKIKKIKNDKEN